MQRVLYKFWKKDYLGPSAVFSSGVIPSFACFWSSLCFVYCISALQCNASHVYVRGGIVDFVGVLIASVFWRSLLPRCYAVS